MTDLSILANTYQPPHNQSLMFCVGFLMFWVVGLFIIMLVFYLVRKQKPLLYVVVISGILLLGGIGLEIYLYEDQAYEMSKREVEYSVELDSASNAAEWVHLPVCTNQAVMEKIHVTSGSATISYIETPNGTALQVNFTGKVSIYSRLSTTEDIGDVMLSLQCSSESWDRRYSSCWAYYGPANMTNYNCSYSWKLHKWHAGSMPVTFYSSGYLASGWNRYQVEIDAPN